MAEKESIDVVNDQIGAPTSARSLTQLLFNIAISEKGSGVYHFSDEGKISWYDFALAIREEGLAAGLIKNNISIHPISTDQYPTLATRPAFSVLDCSNTEAEFTCARGPWREQLNLVIQDLTEKPQAAA